MVSLSTLMKLAKGGLSPEELCGVLSALGMDMESMEQAKDPKAAFTDLARTASLPSAAVIKIKGRMKSGEVVHALLVSAPPAPKQ